MKWTNDKPTKPGWYWWRATNARQRVFEIYNHCGRLHVNGHAVKLFSGQWAGPLDPPEEHKCPTTTK